MSENVHILQVKKLQLPVIKLLWEKLNALHLEDSVYFKEHYSTFTFEKRTLRWSKLAESDIIILIAKNTSENIVGYCVSTIHDNEGEVDSIFVEAEYRKHNIGKQLVETSIEWLKHKGCSKIKLGVSFGHESVFKFYQKLGFYPRMTMLELKNNEE